MANYQVVKGPRGEWTTEKKGADKASGVFDTQAAAIERAKELARNSGGGEVRHQGLDGRWRDDGTQPPAKDPFPPKG